MVNTVIPNTVNVNITLCSFVNIHYRHVITSDVFVVVAIVLITAFQTNFQSSIHYHFANGTFCRRLSDSLQTGAEKQTLYTSLKHMKQKKSEKANICVLKHIFSSN